MRRADRIPGVVMSLADLLLGAAGLGAADEEARVAIRELLGIALPSPGPADAALGRLGAWGQNLTAAATAAPAASTAPARLRLIDDTAPIPRTPPAADATLVEPMAPITIAAPAWAQATDRPAFVPAAGSPASLPPPPLFAPRHARAILAAALATAGEGTEPDLPAIIGSLAAGRALQSIPRRNVRTLRRGAQLLVDTAPAMDPFAVDLPQLLGDLAALLGRGRHEQLTFRHCPGRRVWRAGARSQAWRPPNAGVPLLVVSDLGIGSPPEDEEHADGTEWQAFAGRARAAGCPVVALVPFGPARWSAVLSREITFLHWSERTTARQVARALREARHARGQS